MAAIAIGEYVYPDKLVVISCGDFIRLIGFVIDPEPNVVQELTQFHRDTIGIDTDILAGMAVLPSPFPDPPEHALVQAVQKLFRKHITLTLERPLFGFKNIGLFRFVQFRA